MSDELAVEVSPELVPTLLEHGIEVHCTAAVDQDDVNKLFSLLALMDGKEPEKPKIRRGPRTLQTYDDTVYQFAPDASVPVPYRAGSQLCDGFAVLQDMFSHIKKPMLRKVLVARLRKENSWKEKTAINVIAKLRDDGHLNIQQIRQGNGAS